ncbi:MAG: hypothetical protein ACJ754_00025 [Pyrinomonadaceae bacterium]
MRNVGIALLVGSVVLAGLSLIIWVLGLLTGFTFGGLVHLLLVFAILVGPAGVVAGLVLILVGGKRNQPR